MARFIQSAEIETKHEESNGVTRRGFLRLVLAGSGLFAGATASNAFAAKPAFAATPAENDYPKQLKIAHLTDIHYFSPKLYSDCPDFTLAENSDRKMFKESAAIADKALADIVADQPDLIVVSGDLTKDGEQVCHQEIHDKIVAAQQQLKQAGKDTKVYVINGNHDINNNANGRDYSSGSAKATPSATPAWFKDLWRDQCYNDDVVAYDAGGENGGSLSYVARPCKGLTFIVVDSGKYSADQTASGQPEHETSGMVSQKLLNWVCNQAKQAKAAGDVVIAMQHHGVVPHFGMEPEVLGEYLVDDYANVANAYADAGISCVFTGHMHANDIASVKSPAGNTIYDIETCATVTYPSETRYSTLTFGRDAKDPKQIAATLALESHSLGAVAYDKYTKYKDAAPISDITAYGNDHLLTEAVITTLGGQIAGGALDYVNGRGGIVKLIADLFKTTPDQLPGMLWNAATGFLGTNKEDGLKVDVPESLQQMLSSLGTKISVWYNAGENKIMIDGLSDEEAAASPASVELNVTAEDLAIIGRSLASVPAAAAEGKTLASISISLEGKKSLTTFLNNMFVGIDSNIIAPDGKGHIQLMGDGTAANPGLVFNLLTDLCKAPLGTDTKHTLFNLVHYAYGIHLHGDENAHAEDWAETAMANIQEKIGSGTDENGTAVNVTDDGSLIGMVRFALNKESAAIVEVLNNVPAKIGDLAVGENTQGNGLILMASFVVRNVGSIVNLVAKDGIGQILPNVPQLVDFVYPLLRTLTHDDNIATDRKFGMPAVSLTDPDYKPNGDNGNQGGNGGNTDNGNGSGSQGGNGQGNGSQDSTGPNNNGSGNSTDTGSSTGNKKPSGNGSSGKGGKLPQTGDSAIPTAAATAAIGAAAIGAGAWKAAHRDNKED